MVSSLALGDEALVTLDNRGDGILDLPLADIRESLAADRSLLGRLGRCPTFRPVVGELLNEVCLDSGGLVGIQ